MIAEDRNGRFSLNPYVMHVKGAARGALYDLHRKRIFPIPASASYVLDLCDGRDDAEQALSIIESESDRAIARSYLKEFTALGFGRFGDDAPQPYLPASGEDRARRLRTLGIELHARDGQAAALNEAAWLGIVEAARRHGPAEQLNIFLGPSGGNPEWTLSLLQRATELAFHHIEVILPPQGAERETEAFCCERGLALCLSDEPMFAEGLPQRAATEARLRKAGGRPRLGRASVLARVTESVLICDHSTYSRLIQGSIHSGSLHLHADGQAYPWRLERHQRLGSLRDGSGLLELLDSDVLIRAWRFNKDSVDRCRDCEFRYACPNSHTFRVEDARPGSAPVNCLYDPYKAEWGYRRGQECFAAAAEILVDRSRRFEVRSVQERPFPKRYLPILEAAVDEIVSMFGLAQPNGTIRYDFYPSLETLQRDLAHRGEGLSGLTELRTGQEIGSVKTSYPCHIHELVHALLFQLNRTPRFFVSEACATMLGRVRIAPEDIPDAPDFGSDSSLRIEGPVSGLRLDDVLAYDDNGALLGQRLDGDVHADDVHAMARWLVAERRVAVDIDRYYDATDESDVPGYFYELGGSFMLWLLQTRGISAFREFYMSGQKRVHFEAVFAMSVAEAAAQWKSEVILEEVVS